MRFAPQGPSTFPLSVGTSVSRFLAHLRSLISSCIFLCWGNNSFRKRVIGSAFGLLILSISVSVPKPVTGKSLVGNCTNALLNWHNKGTGVNSYRRWIDPRFSRVKRDLIEEALRIAVRRIQQKRNWEQIQDLYSYAWVTSNSLSLSGLCSEPGREAESTLPSTILAFLAKRGKRNYYSIPRHIYSLGLRKNCRGLQQMDCASTI